MEVKQYLAGIGRIQAELNLLLARREELFSAAGVTAIRYNKDRVQTSPSNTFEAALINMIDKTAADDRRIRYLRREVEKRTKQIRQMGGRYGAVLYCRYVKEMTWAQTCQKLGLQYRSAMVVHNKALAKFDRMYGISCGKG